MIRLTLRLRRTEQPVRSAAAFFLPGGDPAQWLQEIVRWNVSHEALRLYPMPAGRHSLAPQGVLVTSVAADPWPSSEIGRGIPFGLASPRLYLPIDAALEPPLTADELDDLLEPERTYVWHPAVGPVCFEPSEVLRPADLLCPPEPDAVVWDFADPGVAFAKRLVGLAPEQTLTFLQIVMESQDDIGTQGDELLDLPPSPHEPPRNPISRLRDRSLASLAGLVHRLAQYAPSTAEAPTWINSLENWAYRQLASFQQGVQAERYKEISRLLNLLEADPDRGLRYAIPLAPIAPRGIGSPGSSLKEHGVDFDLGQLGGGKPVDLWNLPHEYRVSLQNRYRELANREIQLARHRRAAYIFAELLGDDDAAANALRAGRHHREAAVLYRDRLKRPLDAAICLEQGGLLTEAADLLEEVGEYERLGDLQLCLEHNDAAEAAYRRAVEQHRHGGDFVNAARLCEVKLNAPDEALAELQRGWPHSTQSILCLRQTFRILGRQGRHEAAQDWIEQLREGRYPAAQGQAVAGLLADLATEYPDQPTQQRAANTTRVVVARRLPTAAPTELQKLLGAIARLAPEDRLLSRDCHRYQQQRTSPLELKTVPRPTGTRHRIHLVQTVQLKESVAWQRAIVTDESIYAAGFEDRQLVVGRCDREGGSREYAALETLDHRNTFSPILLMHSRTPQPDLLVHVLGSNPIVPRRIFPGRPGTVAQGLLAGGTRGVSGQVIAATCAASGVKWLIEARDEQLILVMLGPTGELLSSHPLPSGILAGTSSALPTLAARDGHVYIAADDTVFTFSKPGLHVLLELPQPIESIVTSLPHTRGRIAATFATGGMLIWHDLMNTASAPFAPEMDAPLVGFNRGFLIAVNEECCEVYHTQADRIDAKARLETPRSRPVAVLPATPANRFMILSQDGTLSVYEVS